MLEKVFKLRENHTTVKTEILAGITTFMTMAYILAVNPNVLSASGMDRGAVFTATVLASFLGTACMALFANYPFALAPGMGLNAYFAYTVVIGMGYPWQSALAAVFVEGVIFILLSLFNIREAIFNSIPSNLKKAVCVGIGLRNIRKLLYAAARRGSACCAPEECHDLCACAGCFGHKEAIILAVCYLRRVVVCPHNGAVEPVGAVYIIKRI